MSQVGLLAVQTGDAGGEAAVFCCPLSFASLLSFCGRRIAKYSVRSCIRTNGSISWSVSGFCNHSCASAVWRM